MEKIITGECIKLIHRGIDQVIMICHTIGIVTVANVLDITSEIVGICNYE